MFLDNHFLFHWYKGYEAKRKRLLKKAPKGALYEFLSTPFPALNTPVKQLDILSVDFETTGLNAKEDKLLSVGFISMSKGQIKLNSSYHCIIKNELLLDKDNVVIHQITDSQKNEGEKLEVVVEALLKALAGKVMLAHYSRIEIAFLRQACIQLYGMAPVFPIIDTLAIAKRYLDNRDLPYDPSMLRLANLRAHYKLPEHRGHNALNDAIATAELLLVQLAHQHRHNNQTLRDIIL
ncbi:MAG: exonuclease domain-containing protein [Colwellia sp.]